MAGDSTLLRALGANEQARYRVINAVAANRATVRCSQNFEHLALNDPSFAQLVSEWAVMYRVGARGSEWGLTRATRLEMALDRIWEGRHLPPLDVPLLPGDMPPSMNEYDHRHDPELRSVLQNLNFLHPSAVIEPLPAVRSRQPPGRARPRGGAGSLAPALGPSGRGARSSSDSAGSYNTHRASSGESAGSPSRDLGPHRGCAGSLVSAPAPSSSGAGLSRSGSGSSRNGSGSSRNGSGSSSDGAGSSSKGAGSSGGTARTPNKGAGPLNRDAGSPRGVADRGAGDRGAGAAEGVDAGPRGRGKGAVDAGPGGRGKGAVDTAAAGYPPKGNGTKVEDQRSAGSPRQGEPSKVKKQ